MSDFINFFVLFILYGAALPTAIVLLWRSSVYAGFILVATVGLALFTGSLSLIMMWLGIFGVTFQIPLITGLYLLLMLPGAFIWWRNRAARQPESPQPLTRYEWGALLIIVLLCAAIVFNALYWAFSRTDAICIYHATAVEMTALEGLIPLVRDTYILYEAYPLQIPTLYTYVYILTGWQHEYLAGFLNSLLVIGLFPAVYYLAVSLYQHRTGWSAMLLLAMTPLLARWASAGTVDLPTAFFYTLAALFAWHLWQHGNFRDAVLAGLMMGLAMWTKNAALVGAPVLLVWLVYGAIQRRFSWRLMSVCVGMCVLIAAPWYLRNLIAGGILIPDTAWIDQAQQTFSTLFIFALEWGIWGISGLIGTIGLMLSAGRIVLRRLDAPKDVLLMLWSVPFFAAWWLFASYDPRFLLIVLPVLCVAGAAALETLLQQLPDKRITIFMPVIMCIVVGLSGLSIFNSIEFKRELITAPLMSHESKLNIVRNAKPLSCDTFSPPQTD